jgi:hypothetical protein
MKNVVVDLERSIKNVTAANFYRGFLIKSPIYLKKYFFMGAMRKAFFVGVSCQNPYDP